MNVLSNAESNTKMAKSMGKGFLLAGLSLRPGDLSGYEVCPWRTKGCTQACVLEYAGRGNMANVQDARDAKTIRVFEDRKGFLADLHADLRSLERKAAREGLQPVCRLNVASDLSWERIDPTLFSAHPGILFYDYTKGIKRAMGTLPSNYQLTYSWNEESSAEQVFDLLTMGRNCAVVFDTVYNPAQGDIRPLPDTYHLPGLNLRSALRVVDGDGDDIRLREIDGHGVIVGLRGKGGRKQVIDGVQSGFILPTIGGRAALAK